MVSLSYEHCIQMEWSDVKNGLLQPPAKVRVRVLARVVATTIEEDNSFVESGKKQTSP